MGVSGWLAAVITMSALEDLFSRYADPVAVGGTVGAVLGVLCGLFTARMTWRSSRLHGVLLRIGAIIVVTGIILGVAFVIWGNEVAKARPGFLSGFTEFLIGLLCFTVAVIALGLWFAGVCARVAKRTEKPS